MSRRLVRHPRNWVLMPDVDAHVRVRRDAFPHDRFGWHNGRRGVVTRDNEGHFCREGTGGSVLLLVEYDQEEGWYPTGPPPWPPFAYPPPRRGWIRIGLLEHLHGPQTPVPSF